MKGTLKKTTLQLVKEFSVPMILSIAWTVYVLWGKEVTVQSIGANLGGAFFFVSWMTGQFFRVRKQAGVENSLSAVEGRIHAITDRLETSTKELVGHITGGDGIIYIRVITHENGDTDWMAMHQGLAPYTMYGVSIRIYDTDLWGQGIAQDNFIEIGDMSLGTARKVFSVNLGSEGSRRFLVYIIARNGHVTQNIHFHKVDDHWVKAIRVECPHRPDFFEVDDGYPRNDRGEVEWA
ncbi:MAG: hypothetical protein ACRES5_30480 [Pseudomonas sp.]